MKLHKARRHQVKLRLGISGASGFGKSYSALLLAYGITNEWSKIAVIDTENGSASLYSHLGNYNILSLNEPYSPERYIEAIRTCESAQSIEVIIIDSITHEWNGNGGCLEIHQQYGGRFQDWGKLTPRHQSFLDAILKSKCHVITTTRRKMDYSLDTTQNGKTKVVKHGTKEITREGFEYELTISFELVNDKHLCKASKDRTGLFADKPEFVINSATGRKLIAWCNEGISLDDVRKEIQNSKDIADLKFIYSKYPTFKMNVKSLIIERKKELEAIQEQLVESSNVTKNNIKDYGINNKK